MATLERATTVVYVASGDVGHHLKQRRLQLGLSLSELSRLSKVDRGVIAKLEAGGSTVRETTIGAVSAALDRMEHETGQDTPDIVTSTIELPDGTRITFSGPADGVAEAAARYVREGRLPE